MPDFVMGSWDFLAGYLVPALLVLTLVVFVHEMGHFLVARWFGIKVDAFSIGFGPEIVGFDDRRGTRWRVSAIPLGGYVKFTGDEDAASLPEIDAPEAPPEARRNLFHSAPLVARAATVAAGPAANFILAVLIFTALFAAFGRNEVSPVVGEVIAGGVAEAAGIKAGDRFVEVDGKAIRSFGDVQRIVTLATGNSLDIVVERAGQRVPLVATPERREVPDGLGGVQRVGTLGVKSAPGGVERLSFSVPEAFGEAVGETATIVERTLTYIGRLIFGRENADQLSGPLRVGQVAGVVASNGGAVALIHLAAILSVSIGLLNLFPVPMLDGGHLVFYAVEGLRGRPLGRRAQEVGHRIGFALVVMLFVFVTFNDIIKLAGL